MDTATVLEALDRDGYAAVEGVLDRDGVGGVRAALEPALAVTPLGRDDFEGRRTRRMYALFAKTRALDALATHPLVLGVLDRVLGHYQLGAPAAIEIGPGEVAQPLHHDDAIYPLPRPHPEVVVNAMWPLDDFTTENGGTRLLPGSHRWGADVPEQDAPSTTPALPAGSLLLYLGSVWHGGGANGTAQSRLGVVIHYSASWLRPVESHLLAVPPGVARDLSPKMQELVGYNVYPPFLGYVDGRHPRRVLERTPG